jgi:hypothetical protein
MHLSQVSASASVREAHKTKGQKDTMEYEARHDPENCNKSEQESARKQRWSSGESDQHACFLFRIPGKALAIHIDIDTFPCLRTDGELSKTMLAGPSNPMTCMSTSSASF